MKGMLLKVKFEKAYNSLSVWDLVYALQKTGFGEKWWGWISTCLRAFIASVLVNGSPTFELQFKMRLS